MKKRYILFFIVMIAIVYFNLRMYSVYYASNMPHSKDKDPVPVMIIENMHFIKRVEDDRYVYSNEGNNMIVYYETAERKSGYGLIKTIDGFDFSLLNSYVAYNFDKNFQFVYGFDSNFEKVNVLTEKSKKNLDKYLKTMLQPIIDIQPHPILNLQFLFNWIYYDSYN